LGYAGHPLEAAAHLEFAKNANPFDPTAARAFHQSLLEIGDGSGLREFGRRTPPSLCCGADGGTLESWFAPKDADCYF